MESDDSGLLRASIRIYDELTGIGLKETVPFDGEFLLFDDDHGLDELRLAIYFRSFNRRVFDKIVGALAWTWRDGVVRLGFFERRSEIRLPDLRITMSTSFEDLRLDEYVARYGHDLDMREPVRTALGGNAGESPS